MRSAFRVACIVYLCSLSFLFAAPPRFVGLPTTFIPTRDGQVAWADYDNDGDLDLMVTGDTWGNAGYGSTELYRNDGGGNFTLLAAELPPFRSSGADWGDFDNDGYVDVLLSGYGAGGHTQVLKNLRGFALTAVMQLTNHVWGGASWGDYNHDGFLDIALTTDGILNPSDPYLNYVYRNQGGTNFVLENFRFNHFYYSVLEWVDYDNDGWLDLFQGGAMNEPPWGGLIFFKSQRGESFSNVPFPIFHYPGYGIHWFDIDNQNGPDLLLSVHSDQGTFVYLNDGSGQFSNAYKFPVMGAFRPADYDNDGQMDMLFSGYENNTNAPTGFRNLTRMYHNEGTGQWTIYSNIFQVVQGGGTWGDYDNDGDLDVALFGQLDHGFFAQLYRNDTARSNTPPEAPTRLQHELRGSSTLLQWAPAADAEQAEGLTYNIRVGTSPGRGDTVSPLSAASGYRRVVRTGNTGWTPHFELTGLKIGQTYYWSVQAIDNSYAGSRFAEEQEFTATTPPGISVSNSITILEDSGKKDLVFHVEDAETPSEALITEANSLNLDLVPQNSIYITGSGGHRTLWFAPAANVTGTAVIRITVTDTYNASAFAFVTVNIAPVNDPPVAHSQSIQTQEDESVSVTLVAIDIDSDMLSYSWTLPARGTLTGEPPNLTYTPARDFFGSDQFSYRAGDAQSWSDWATVTIEVAAVNDPPISRPRVFSPFLVRANANTYVVVAINQRHVPITFDGRSSSDVEGDDLTYAWYLDGNRQPFSVAERITRQIRVGTHRVTLAVSDGSAVGSTDVYLTVITPADPLRTKIRR